MRDIKIKLPAGYEQSEVIEETAEFKLPEGYEQSEVVDASSKKKVPTATAKVDSPQPPIGEESSTGSSKTQPTSGLEPSQSPTKTTTIKVGGKDFTVPDQPDLTSTEVRSRANILFKNASPVTPPEPSLEIEAEPAFKNVSQKIIKGNEGVLSTYVKNLPFDDQDKLRKVKLDDEKSFELLTKAYTPYLNGLANDIEILKSRGVESSLQSFESQTKELEKNALSIQQSQKELQKLQETFLTQKGYDKLAKEYATAAAQIKQIEKTAQPIIDQKNALEAKLQAFAPLIKDGQFTGDQNQFNEYNSLIGTYNQVIESPELQQLNQASQKVNQVAGQVNKLITPEYRERADKLANDIKQNAGVYQQKIQDFDQEFTPEKRSDIEQYIQFNDQYRNGLTNLEVTQSKIPSILEKQQEVATK